ncbi:MAG: S8 family peptidase [Chitinophagales bacterium]|nr:S8 family peptidase [Chitinophagales bacterium]MDW8418454.1 S8 family peptidase [Chitinophagales bacterium]
MIFFTKWFGVYALCFIFGLSSDNMKKSLTYLLLLTHIALQGQRLETDYTAHYAPDRVLLQFHPQVTYDSKSEILSRCASIIHYTHLPSPALTLCEVRDAAEVIRWAAGVHEIKYVGCFITDGRHYAGVLNKLFVKIKHAHFETLLLQWAARHACSVRPDEYIKNLYHIESLPVERDPIAWSRELQREGWCQYAAPNLLLNPVVGSNDPHYARQWAIENKGTPLQHNGTPDADMDVDSAWTITEGSPDIKIAIIDSGVDTLHNDLKDNMLPGYDAVSDSTDGFPTPAYPNDGHGTCCAGIAAATKDNGTGIAGVAPKCKIIPVRAFYYIKLPNSSDPIPFSTAEAFMKAIGWSWSNAQADILSNSWGLPASLIPFLPGGTQPVEDAIQAAYTQGRQGKGIAMFFSSGNDNDSTGAIWPSSLPQTIAVTATDMCDKRKAPGDCSGENWGANYGAHTDIAAPGVKIVTTDMRGTKGYTNADYYNFFNGTSAACPHAAAVGALLLSIKPWLTPEDIRHLLATTADKTGGYAYNQPYPHGWWSKELGYGRVNAYQALLKTQAYTSIEPVGENQSVKAFPNPANDRVCIRLNKNTMYEICITDLSGRELWRGQSAEGEAIIDITTWTRGIYYIRLSDKCGDTKTLRLLVL